MSTPEKLVAKVAARFNKGDAIEINSDEEGVAVAPRAQPACVLHGERFPRLKDQHQELCMPESSLAYMLGRGRRGAITCPGAF